MTKHKTRETHSDYIDRIDSKFKRLGNGAFANVYQHPKRNVVVKVFDAKDDKGYARYLKWAEKNQQNPYVPKIHHVERFTNKRENEEITVVFMEKLKAARYKHLEELIDKLPLGYDLDQYSSSEWFRVSRSDVDDKHLIEIAKFFCQELPEGVDLDLHDENYMRRNNGQIVFTDPFA